MRVKLSQNYIDTTKCPEHLSRIELVDENSPGLYYLMSTTTEPGHGTYYSRWKDPTGKTCHTKLGKATDLDLSQARAANKQLRAEISLGANPQAKANAQKEVLTFSDFFETHYLPHAKCHKRSWQRDEELYRLRLKDAFGKKRLNQITRHEIMKFHSGLPDLGLAPATCDHHVKLLKHALNLAIDWEFLNSKNPAARVPQFNMPNALIDIPSDDQVRKLLLTLDTYPNQKLAAIIRILLASGARTNEVLQAKWCHIDRVNRLWHVPAEISKSKKPRVIQISEALMDCINSLQTEGKYDYLFINETTGKPLTTITKAFGRLRKELGFYLRLHTCRHMYITWALEGGASLFQVAQLAGHANPITTQAYAHLSRSVLQGAANNTSVRLKSLSVGLGKAEVVA